MWFQPGLKCQSLLGFGGSPSDGWGRAFGWGFVYLGSSEVSGAVNTAYKVRQTLNSW